MTQAIVHTDRERESQARTASTEEPVGSWVNAECQCPNFCPLDHDN